MTNRPSIWLRIHQGIMREIDMYLSLHWIVKVMGLLLLQFSVFVIFIRFFGKTVRFFWRVARGR